MNKYEKKQNEAFVGYITISIGIIIYNSLFMILFISKLLFLHTLDIFNNITFYEEFKEKFKYSIIKNPYNQ